MRLIMTRLVMLTVATALLAMAQPSASLAAEGKLATINIQAILRDSAAAKSTKDQIEAKKSQYQSELKAIEGKLEKNEQALIEQKSLLSPDALEKKRDEFIKEVTAARREAEEKRLSLNDAQGQALGDIQEAVVKIVEKMAAERGYEIVVPTSQLLYAIPSLDITDEVMKQLDKDLPKVKINFKKGS